MSTDFGKIENVIEAKFRIVTPMFLGGADQQAEDIRPSSVKGMLRFWWRALNWSRLRGVAGETDTSALSKLHDEEARLFGSAANDGKGGQGVFLLSVQTQNKQIGKPAIPQFSSLHYMAGQGVVFQKDASKDRNALLSGEFTVKLRFRDTTNEHQRSSVVEALRVFGLLGGMGARGRRGFGSIALLEINGVATASLPITVAEYRQAINQLLGTDLSAQEPPLTALSRTAKIAFSQAAKDPMKVIEIIGKEMGLYRGFGMKRPTDSEHKTFGIKSEQNFTTDHNEMLNVAKGQTANQHPKRLIFGMPHNYFFSSAKKSAQIQKTVGRLERRASPLLVHVHPIRSDYIGVLLMMRSTFLPPGEKVLIGRSEVAVAVDWKVIETFMQRPAFTQGAKA